MFCLHYVCELCVLCGVVCVCVRYVFCVLGDACALCVFRCVLCVRARSECSVCVLCVYGVCVLHVLCACYVCVMVWL